MNMVKGFVRCGICDLNNIEDWNNHAQTINHKLKVAKFYSLYAKAQLHNEHIDIKDLVKKAQNEGVTAYNIWCSWSAILESTIDKGNFNNLRSTLIETREYFKNEGKNGIVSYINEIILKEAETDPNDWEDIRFLLHMEWEENQPKPKELFERIKKKYGSL